MTTRICDAVPFYWQWKHMEHMYVQTYLYNDTYVPISSVCIVYELFILIMRNNFKFFILSTHKILKTL